MNFRRVRFPVHREAITAPGRRALAQAQAGGVVRPTGAGPESPLNAKAQGSPKACATVRALGVRRPEVRPKGQIFSHGLRRLNGVQMADKPQAASMLFGVVDRLAVPKHFTRGQPSEPGHEAQKRRFTAAVRTA